MPIVTAGTTASHTFTAQDSVLFDVGSAEVVNVQVLSSIGARLFSSPLTRTQIIGPFPVGAVMTVTAVRGDADYTVVDQENYQTQLTLNEFGQLSPGAALNAQPAKPVRLMLAGASQYSRCSTELLVASAQIINEVLYITHAAPPLMGVVSGAEAFCAVDGHFVFGRVTVLTDTTLTIPAPGRSNTTANTGGTQFLHFTGMHAGSSWIGHLQSRYGGGMKFVGNVSQHGANIQDVAARMDALLGAIALKRPDIVVFEPGWGNSFNQGLSWNNTMPLARESLRRVCAVVPTVALATLPPIAPGGSPTAEMVDNFHRINAWLRNGDVLAEFPNVVVVDSTTALQDFSRSDAGSIAVVHSDSLHWTPLGAYVLANSCFAPILDRLIPQLPIARGGASHVWANGNRQLFDGLLSSSGYTTSAGGSSGTMDNTMAIARAGGAGSAVCSLVARSNGMYLQRVAMSGMASTAVYTITISGAAGALLKDRMSAGKTYRPVVRMSIGSLAGTIKAISVIGQISLTGHPGTMPRMIWAGRTQEGAVEGGSSVFPQTAAEASRDYIGYDFTVPAGATVTDFSIGILVRSGASSSGVTLDIEDVAILDVTNA